MNQIENYLNRVRAMNSMTPSNIRYQRISPAPDLPQQQDGSSCGIFCVLYARDVVRRQESKFTQLDVDEYRRRAMYKLAYGVDAPKNVNLSQHSYTNVLNELSQKSKPLYDVKENEVECLSGKILKP